MASELLRLDAIGWNGLSLSLVAVKNSEYQLCPTLHSTSQPLEVRSDNFHYLAIDHLACLFII